MIRKCAPFLALLFASVGSYAQPAAKLEFEVASIKPSPPQPNSGIGFAVGCHGGPGTSDPALFICENYSHLNMVLHAYGIAYYQLSAPDWMLTTRFDLRATVPEGATKEQLPLMLQSLLAERLKLKVHHETREIQRYDLVVVKGGPKFKEAAPATAKATDRPQGPTFPPKFDENGCPVVSPQGGAMFTLTKSRVRYPEMTMDFLAGQLSSQMRGPVTDMTGLIGKYNVDLCWSPDSLHASAPGADPATLASEPSGPTLQQALEDQLGLRLEPKKGPVDFLVVDHAEKIPTEN